MRKQEKEKIMRELIQLQADCIKEYLEDKLYSITTQEVVKDIVNGFIEVNNVQFIEGITENIVETKSDNKMLRKQIDFLKITHSQSFEQVKTQILEEYRQSNETIYQQEKLELMQKINLQSNEKSELTHSLEFLEEKNKDCEQSLKKEKEEKAKVQNELKEMTQSCQFLKQENIHLRNDLDGLQKNSQKFKQQCEQLIKQKNDQIERQLQKSRVTIHSQRNEFEKTIKEFNEKIEYLKSELVDKNQTILTLKHKLVGGRQNHQKEANLYQKYRSQSSQQIHLLSLKVKQYSQTCQTLENEKQSMVLSLKYLQEENQYLREEIITFRNRYQSLSDQKDKIQQELQLLRQSTNNQIHLLNLSKLELQQSSKITLQQCREQYQIRLKEKNEEISSIQEEKNILEETKTKQIETVQKNLEELKEENKCMSTQLQFHFNQNEVHQKQIQFHQEEALRVNSECREQLETFKKTYQMNWNSTNEAFLEQKYKNKVFEETVCTLQEKLQIEKEKEKMYTLYIEENAHLKKQLDVLLLKGKFLFDPAELRIGNVKDKFRYYITKIKHQLQDLKTQNKELKNITLKQHQQYQQCFSDQVYLLAAKIKEQSMKCLHCEHERTLKSPLRSIEHPQLGFQKTLPRMNAQSASFSTLKKSLKNIQQQYQHLNRQNKHYTEHLDNLMKKA